MTQSSTANILPIFNPELTEKSEPSGYSWKTLTKAGLVFVTTTGAFLALKATGSFSLLSSWLRSSSFENDSSESSVLANLNDPSAQEVYSTPVNKGTPILLKSDVVKYVSSLHEGVWGCQVGMILGTAGAIVTKNPLVMGIGALACWPQVEAQSSSSSSLLQEDFESTTLDPSWEVVNFPGYGRYSLTDNQGYLRYYLEGSKGSSNNGWRVNYVPSGGWNPTTTLLRSFNGTKWVLETKVDYNLHYRVGVSSTGSQCPQFYIAFGNEVDNYIRIERSVDYAYTINHLVAGGQNTNGIPELLWNNTDNLRAPNDIDVNEWMRYTYDYKIERTDGDVSVYISFDSAPYSLIRSFTLPLSIGDTQKIIIDQTVWTTAGSYADWDYFHVTALDETESSSKSSLSDQSASNEMPILVNNALSIEKGGTRILDTETLGATDPDNSDAELLFTVSDSQHGEFQFVNGTAITEFTQQEVTARNIQFVHNDSMTAPSYWISVGDGNVSTNPAHVIVDFEAYVPLNEEFQVNTYTNYDQFVPSVASLNDGKFVVTWISSNGQDGHNYGVFGQMFNNNGTRYDTEFQVNTYTKDNQGGPSVAVLSDGKFVVVYDSNRPISNVNTFGQMYNNNGTRYGGEFQINTYTQGLESEQEIAGLSDGKFVVTWADYGDPRDGSGDGVFAQMFHNNGTRYNDEFQVNTYTNNDQVGPYAASLSDDKFVIVWHSYVQDAGSIGAYGQMYYNNGTRYGEEFQVNTYTNNDQGASGVACLSDGKFVIVWQSDGQDGSFHGVYGRLYNVNGTRYSDEFQVNTYTNDYQSGPEITSLSNGKFVVTWGSYYGQDGSNGGTYAQMYNNDGTRYGREFQANTYTVGNQWDVSIAGLNDDKFVITWDSEGQDGSGKGVYARLYARDISPILTKNTLSIKEGSTKIFTTENLGATDPDNDDTTLTFNISNLSGGTFESEVSPDNWTAATQFIQQQITNAKIRFIDDGDEIAPSYDVSVSDETLSTPPLPASIVFAPVSKSSLSSSTTIVSSLIVSSSSISPIVSSSYQTDSVSSSKMKDSSPSSTRSIISKLSSSPSASSSSKKSSDLSLSSNLVSLTTSSSHQADSMSSSEVADSSFSSTKSISSYQASSPTSSKITGSSSIFSSNTDSKTTSSLGLEDSSEKNSNEPTMPAWATALIGIATPGMIISLGLFVVRMYIKKQKTDAVRVERYKEKHPVAADFLETMRCSVLTTGSKQFTDFVERKDGLIDKLQSEGINYRSLPQREKNLIIQFAKEAIRNVTPKPNLYQIFTHKTITPDDVLVLDDQLEDIANKIAANLDTSRTEIVDIEHGLNNT